ncbi:hypothetical protein [Piscinibacter gummiphilus]|uniref:Uncharacterized protein n=1 Tax=Piscinibacter gummiphilus TaxID=946333 RepID=A0ABZ0CTT5_9BURK|nr:hypothetical protein [Piscinibacter gummiphilus]WOB06521.1 hypothetical protein RXV79_16485 [Piscinibacter gummiphilus]
MPIRLLPFPPTRVNNLFLHGPRFHFERITADQLKSLGLSEGDKAEGATVRRLRDGRYNAIIDSVRLAKSDDKFAGFMSRVTAPHELPVRHDLDSEFSETGSVGLDEV